jgi:hypothetical protein
MADASSIRKTTTPLASPAVGALPSQTQSGAGFYESAIRFQLNDPMYHFTYVDGNGITQHRTTGQAYINSGAQWVPVGNVVLSIPLQNADDAVNQNIFIADRTYNVLSMKETHAVVAAGAFSAQVQKCTGTTAPGSGSAVMTDTFDLTSAINTPVTGTLNTGCIWHTKLAAGDRLALAFGGTATGYAGGNITIVLQPA